MKINRIWKEVNSSGPKYYRSYSLLNETNTNHKDREYLLKYHEEDDYPEYDIQEGTIYKEGGYGYLDCGFYPYGSSDPSYLTIRFDESLVPEIYQLCENETHTTTIYDYIIRKGGECIRWQHSKYYIWEDEEVYGPHDPNDPRYNYSYSPIETIEDKDVGPLPF